MMHRDFSLTLLSYSVNSITCLSEGGTNADIIVSLAKEQKQIGGWGGMVEVRG